MNTNGPDGVHCHLCGIRLDDPEHTEWEARDGTCLAFKLECESCGDEHDGSYHHAACSSVCYSDFKGIDHPSY